MPELVENAAESWNLGRVLVSGGHPWFRGKDAATSLGYENQLQALHSHVMPKHKATLKDLSAAPTHDLQGRRRAPLANQQLHELYVNEPGLYSLIFRSKLPKAEAFADWVFEEVLPPIRKTARFARAAHSAATSTEPPELAESKVSVAQSTQNWENWAEMASRVSDVVARDNGEMLKCDLAHFRKLAEEMFIYHLNVQATSVSQALNKHWELLAPTAEGQASLMRKMNEIARSHDDAKKRDSCMAHRVAELEMGSELAQRDISPQSSLAAELTARSERSERSQTNFQQDISSQLSRGMAALAAIGERLEIRDAEMNSNVAAVADCVSSLSDNISDLNAHHEEVSDKVGSLAHNMGELRKLHSALVNRTAVERQIIDLASPQSSREKTELVELGNVLNAEQLRALNSKEGVVKVATWFRKCYLDLLAPPPEISHAFEPAIGQPAAAARVDPAELWQPTEAARMEPAGLLELVEPAEISQPPEAANAEPDFPPFSALPNAEDSTVFNRCRWVFIKEAKRRKIESAPSSGGKPLRLFFSRGGVRIVYTRETDAELLQGTFDDLKETDFPEIAACEARRRKRPRRPSEASAPKKQRGAQSSSLTSVGAVAPTEEVRLAK